MVLNLALAAVALGIKSEFSDGFLLVSVPFVLSTVLYICMMVSFVIVYFYYRNSKALIYFDGECISVPRLLLPSLPRKLKLSDVASAEFLNRKKQRSLIIGLRNRYPLPIEESMCESAEALAELGRILNRSIDRRVGGEEARTTRELLNLRILELGSREYSIAILSLVLLVFHWITIKGFSEDHTLSDPVISLGASTPGIFTNLELYRVFSSFVLHYNAIHLLSNIAIFVFIGQFLVKLIGTIRFLNIILFSSVAGVILSSLSMEYDASFGASGGGFGLLGAYAMIKIHHQECLPAIVNPIPFWVLVLVLVFELFAGYYIEAIDLYNHLGGFTAGALLIYIGCLRRDTLFNEPAVLEKIMLALILGCYFWGISRFLVLL